MSGSAGDKHDSVSESESEMRSYTDHLRDAIIAGLLGLPVGVLAGGIGIGVGSFVTNPARSARIEDAIMTGLGFSWVALLIGIPFVLLYGAPVHALLARRGFSNYLTTAAVGALPGAAIMLRESGIGFVGVYFGVCISVAGQWVANRRMRGQGLAGPAQGGG